MAEAVDIDRYEIDFEDGYDKADPIDEFKRIDEYTE